MTTDEVDVSICSLCSVLSMVINFCCVFSCLLSQIVLLCGDNENNPGRLIITVSQLLAPLMEKIRNLVQLLTFNVCEILY